MSDDSRGARAVKVSRRELLIATGAASLAGGVGLVLGAYVGKRLEGNAKRVPPRAQAFAPSVYLAIDGEGAATVWLTRSEMGQGVATALPMLVAEELEIDWRRVRLELAQANRNYGSQYTAGSSSVRSLWQPLRQAGAAAREMLVAAAAAQWGVETADCDAREGSVVLRADGRRIGYEALVEDASRLAVPASPRLKPANERRLLGTRVPLLDVAAKSDGSARYGVDVRLPGMRFATVLRCPVFGGKVQGFDAKSVSDIAGVDEVFEIEPGIAIVGQSSWAVLSAARRLQVRWDEGPTSAVDDAALAERLEAALDGAGHVVESRGDPALLDRGRRVEARYRAPHLAHATMEPINATAWMRAGRCEIWAPTQAPQRAQQLAMELTGLREPDVIVHVTLLGGGFGRRSSTVEVGDAVRIARRVKGPVQVLWSREEDIQHDGYRPISHHHLQAALDAEGWPLAWRHRVATPGDDPERAAGASAGAAPLPYALSHVETSWAGVASPVPTGAWRSVSHSYNAFAVECFVDELARAGGHDPVELRRRLLRESPRDLAVLERAAELAEWGSSTPTGVARGVAVHPGFESHIAMVAEVRIAGGKPRVERVVAVVDCGQIVHPGIVEAQIEGSVVFGLTAALHGRIELREGRVVQSNFHDYRMLRFPDMPEVQVEILRSDEPPGGVGELGVPPIAPAVANAVHALTGKPVRSLPIALS